jgi:ssDNA-binding replication factor A large subunit
MATIMALSTIQSQPNAITIDAITSLSQYDKVSINIKVIRLFPTQEVDQDKKVKRDVLIADSTGYTKVVLWEQHINALTEGKSCNLHNFHVREFQSYRCPNPISN